MKSEEKEEKKDEAAGCANIREQRFIGFGTFGGLPKVALRLTELCSEPRFREANGKITNYFRRHKPKSKIDSSMSSDNENRTRIRSNASMAKKNTTGERQESKSKAVAIQQQIQQKRQISY